MQEQTVVTGLIIKQTASGESDKRITILTNSHGKISVFARGARKPNSRFSAATEPFCFGEFKLYEGRDAYNLADADIKNYFQDFRKDVEASFYASYFAEIVDYYCRENNDEREMLKLIYQAFRALLHPSFPNRLVRCVFELKSIIINGEYPGVPGGIQLSDSAVYTLEFIKNTPPEKIYTFTVTDEVLCEIERVAELYCHRIMDHHFKSLDILKTMICE